MTLKALFGVMDDRDRVLEHESGAVLPRQGQGEVGLEPALKVEGPMPVPELHQVQGAEGGGKSLRGRGLGR